MCPSRSASRVALPTSIRRPDSILALPQIQLLRLLVKKLCWPKGNIHGDGEEERECVETVETLFGDGEWAFEALGELDCAVCRTDLSRERNEVVRRKRGRGGTYENPDAA